MLARDIMRKKVVTVSADSTLQETARLFIDKRISGAPVTDGKGRLIGVISQTDLVRKNRERSASSTPVYYGEDDQWARCHGYLIEDPDLTRVDDVMTPAILSAKDTTPIEELARLMLSRHIHRIIITRDGRLCGIVTSMDMLRALL